MNNWLRIVCTPKEMGINNPLTKFLSIINTLEYKFPCGFIIFKQSYYNDTDDTAFYISPNAQTIFESVINQYETEVCELPPRNQISSFYPDDEEADYLLEHGLI